jgi:hypothetical protein
LLRVVWADPQHMPEHLALWALKYFGPRAAAAARGDPDDVIARQTRLTVVEGAAVGGPFILLIPVAWCAALLAQAQMVFELAALAGYSATDEMRAADLLVLQGAYGSTAAARTALAAVTEAPQPSRRLRMDMIWRMAYMLGLLGPGGAQRGLLRKIFGWVFVGVVFLVGLVLPVVWVPYMAVWMRKSTLQLGERTIAYYAEGAGGDAGVTVGHAQGVRIGLAGGFVRMALLLGVSVALFVVALVGGGVGAGVLLLVTISFVLTSAVIGYRWWRRRHARASRLRAASGPGP